MWLTSCLTGLDSTKQVNMLIILKLQSNWAFSEWSIYDSVYQLGLFVRDLYIEASCYDCMFCLQMLCYKSNRSSLELNKIFGNYRSIKFNFFVRNLFRRRRVRNWRWPRQRAGQRSTRRPPPSHPALIVYVHRVWAQQETNRCLSLDFFFHVFVNLCLCFTAFLYLPVTSLWAFVST